VEDLAFSMDGRTLASIDSDGVVRLWSMPVGAESTQAAELPRHPTEVEACGFTPDGRTLISICSEVQGFQHGENFSGATRLVTVNAAEIRLWDAETGAPMQRLEAGHQQPSCLSFSSDSQHLAISSRRFGGDPIRIWNRKEMIPETELRGHRSSVGMCSYTRDGRRIVSMGFSTFRSRPEDNALMIWDSITGIEIATLVGHGGELAGFDISPNGRFAVASSDVVASAVKTPGVIADTRGDFFDALSGPLTPVDLFLWDLEKRAKCASLEGCFRPSFSPDGKAVIAISGGDEWAVLWQFASTDATTSTTPVRSGVSAARFTPDARELALGLRDGTVALVDPGNGNERLRLRRAGEKVGLGLFSPDGRFMVDRTASTVRVWNVDSGERVAVFPAPADLRCVAIGRDITKLAIGDKLGGVSLLGVSGIQPGPSVVTATRTWRFGPHGSWRRRFGFFSPGKMDARPTVICPLCEAEFEPDSRPIDAIEGIAREADLAPNVSPAIALPREAWDEPGLLSSCERCGAALRFNPFIA
jgi:WD40 repeat protein